MAQKLPQEDFGRPKQGLDWRRLDFWRLGFVALFFAGLFVLAFGLGAFFFKGQSSSEDIQIIKANSDEPSQQNKNEILVHVDGAVLNSGVYKLPADSRVDDAIKAAGGYLEGADRSKVNLAAKLADGQKIYVSRVNESTGQSVQGESTGLININTASQSDLEKLPGIGPVTAQKIIASRHYSDSGDLLSKKVVTRSVYEKIKELITVF